jgi:predicted DNA-binding protein YlxM (UPF0122 family)
MDTTERIIAALKAGEIDEAEAQRLLDECFEFEEVRQRRREIPVGLVIDDAIIADVYERENALLTVINSLPPRQAQCVEMYYFDGYNQEQISERIGIPQQNVSAHLAAARKKLAEILNADCVKTPSHRFNSREVSQETITANLMRDEIRKQKRTTVPFYPFELWQRYNAGARWTRYNEYRPVVENRLPEYLAACFAVPPVVGSFTRPRRK